MLKVLTPVLHSPGIKGPHEYFNHLIEIDSLVSEKQGDTSEGTQMEIVPPLPPPPPQDPSPSMSVQEEQPPSLSPQSLQAPLQCTEGTEITPIQSIGEYWWEPFFQHV